MSRPSSLHLIRSSLVLLVVLGSSTGLLSAQLAVSKREIEPGPTTQSTAERALQASAGGREHGIVLTVETERDDNRRPLGYRIRHHFRAKIFSNEGRDLGNLVIPCADSACRIRKFWARTILPGGEVFEIDKGDLIKQILVEGRRDEAPVYKAVLPALAPGVVVDMGYEIESDDHWEMFWTSPVPVQQAWPVRDFYYHWAANRDLNAAYFLSRPQQLAIEAVVAKRALTMVAENIPGVIDEPHMPPASEARVHFFPYYKENNLEGTKYWSQLGKHLMEIFDDFAGSSSRRRRMLEEIGVPEGPLEQRLRYLYDWLLENIENVSYKTEDEIAAARGAKDKKKRMAEDARGVLKKRRADSWQIRDIFVALARELGAEASIVWVVDRRDAAFHPEIYSLRQFDAQVVSLGWPGAEEQLYLDPGTGRAWGEVPWWSTGGHGFRVGEKTGSFGEVPSGSSEDNVLRAEAQLEYNPEGDLQAFWTVVGSGHAGEGLRESLRYERADRRGETLRQLCGESAHAEVLRAEAPGLEARSGDYRLECEVEVLGDGDLDDADRLSVSFAGPWIERLPRLRRGDRHHPVVLDFPSRSEASVFMAAPEGFAPGDPPDMRFIDSRYGRYTLDVHREEDGFRVERSFQMKVDLVDPRVYAHFVEWLDKLRAADDTRLVFVRQD